MAQTLNLTFMSGARDGEIVQIEASGSPQTVSIGRSAPCDLVIPDDPDLSRRHARIVGSGASWMLEDLNSSNGTFIGEFQSERKLSAPTAIMNGEIFRVGLSRLRLGGAKNEHYAAACAVAKGVAISSTFQCLGLTPAACELLRTVDAGGIPAFVTGNLKQIALDNGVDVTDDWTPNEIIEAIRSKAQYSGPTS